MRAVRVAGRRPYEALRLIADAELLGTAAAQAAAVVAARAADAVVQRRYGSWQRAVASVADTPEDARIRRDFAVGGALRYLLHANVIVLKTYRGEGERGVLLIKYSEVLNAFPALFDMNEIQRRYHLVLEPSTMAVLQPIARLVSPELSVVAIQCMEPRSARELQTRGMLPLDVSDGDWVDEEIFRFLPDVEKRFDLIMVAHFLPYKRHDFLLESLRTHWKGDLRFALVASSHVAGGADRGRRLLEQYELTSSAELHTDVSQRDVNALLNASRCHVLCSLREGANRSSFEALFAGIPALVPQGHIGFPYWRFPRALVRTFTDGASLVDEIRACRHNADPAEITTTVASVAGARAALARLEGALRQAVEARGECWTVGLTPKVTRVQSFYRDPRDFERHAEDFAFLAGATRGGFTYDSDYARALLTSLN